MILLRHRIIQILIGLHHAIHHIPRTDGSKVTAGTFYLGIFGTTKLRHFDIVAFGFGHEIDVLHRTLTEGHSPVGVVLAHRGIDVEATGEFAIYHHIVFCFKRFGKAFLNAFAIHHYEIVERLRAFNGILSQSTAQGGFFEDVGAKGTGTLFILDMLNERDGFAVVDDATSLDDKLFRVELELVKCARLDAFKHFHNSASRKTGRLHQFTYKIIRYL